MITKLLIPILLLALAHPHVAAQQVSVQYHLFGTQMRLLPGDSPGSGAEPPPQPQPKP